MYQEERHRLIIESARRDGRVDSVTLAEDFDVSLETVRRDLTVLERQGLLKRTHGGAVPLQRTGFDVLLTARAQLMVEEKRRIAKAAVDFLPEEGSILLDGGTTVAMLAELLPLETSLTVVTNALPITVILGGHKDITLLVVGGILRERSQCVVGEWALHNLHDVRVDVAFLGTNGLTVERGISTADQREAEVKRAMLRAARKVVLMTDHTKIGLDDFCRFGDLGEIDALVTDSGLDPDLEAELRSAVENIVVA